MLAFFVNLHKKLCVERRNYFHGQEPFTELKKNICESSIGTLSRVQVPIIQALCFAFFCQPSTPPSEGLTACWHTLQKVEGKAVELRLLLWCFWGSLLKHLRRDTKL